ncbi:hypothetical protein [Natronococcus jeotgali]|uniref:hypothetical protein n=1 Tax=Natronococcus jeotgali TaxID=413812 RepID=UPI001267B928|nr:hypothetical protein [Natronococcus jeotgali]
MPKQRRVGVAPLVIGVVLLVQSLSQLVQNGQSIWAAVSLIGSVAAIFVGAKILLTEDVDSNGRKESTTALASIALLSFIVGSVMFIV